MEGGLCRAGPPHWPLAITLTVTRTLTVTQTLTLARTRTLTLTPTVGRDCGGVTRRLRRDCGGVTRAVGSDGRVEGRMQQRGVGQPRKVRGRGGGRYHLS